MSNPPTPLGGRDVSILSWAAKLPELNWRNWTPHPFIQSEHTLYALPRQDQVPSTSSFHATPLDSLLQTKFHCAPSLGTLLT